MVSEIGFDLVAGHGHHLAVESVVEPLVLLDWDAMLSANFDRGHLARLDAPQDRRAGHAESLGSLRGGQ